MVSEHRFNINKSLFGLSISRVISIKRVIKDLRIKTVGVNNPEMFYMSVPFRLEMVKAVEKWECG
jgi:hypothetical protein